jgi:tetratricopeptide (TPR) repeat protein
VIWADISSFLLPVAQGSALEARFAVDITERKQAEENLRQSDDLLQHAIERDPQYGPALALAAMCQQNFHLNGWMEDPDTDRSKAVNLARRALQVAGDDPNALGNVAYVLGCFGEDIDAAVELIDRALAFNPSFAIAWQRSGWLRLWGPGDQTLRSRISRPHRASSPRDRPAGPFMRGRVSGRSFDGR